MTGVAARVGLCNLSRWWRSSCHVSHQRQGPQSRWRRRRGGVGGWFAATPNGHGSIGAGGSDGPAILDGGGGHHVVAPTDSAILDARGGHTVTANTGFLRGSGGSSKMDANVFTTWRNTTRHSRGSTGCIGTGIIFKDNKISVNTGSIRARGVAAMSVDQTDRKTGININVNVTVN